MNTGLLTVLIGAIFAFGGTMAGLFFGRRKNNAETEEIAAQTYRNLNQDLLLQLKNQKIEYQSQIDAERKEWTDKMKERETNFLQRMAEKDKIISDQSQEILNSNTRINLLEERVDSLEKETNHYKTLYEQKIEELKNFGHEVVEQKFNELKEGGHIAVDQAVAELQGNILPPDSV